jgi:hypothetical protein
MAYFTGEIKNPFQDPIRKETVLKERKPLKESMLQRIAYFISSASKKMSFKEFVQNYYGKNTKEVSSIEESNIASIVNSSNVENKSLGTNKKNHYFKVRNELLKQERNDRELFNLCECLPTKEQYNDTNGQEQYILEYTDKWQRPNQLAIDIKNGFNKKRSQSYHIKNLKSRNKAVYQLLQNLTQTANPKSHSVSQTTHTSKRKNSFMNFIQRQFQHEFKTISGRNYPKEKLNHTSTISRCPIKLPPTILPNIPLPVQKIPSKYNINRVFEKERKLSHLLLKGVCKDGFLRQKYSQFMKQDSITPVKKKQLILKKRQFSFQNIALLTLVN